MISDDDDEGDEDNDDAFLCRWCVELCDCDPLWAMTETHLTFSQCPR